MTATKARKILLIVSAALLVIQIPWFFVIQAMVNKSQTRTIATVIRIESNSAGCTGDSAGRTDFTCDHSAKEYPVYEYYDLSGKRYEQDDRFFGEYKRNNPLRALFWKDVGDKATTYYTKDKPQEALFMTGPLAYTAWLIPLYVSLLSLTTSGVLYAVQKLKQY